MHTQFVHLDDWRHGSEGSTEWSRDSGTGSTKAYAGGGVVGCLSHTILSSHRPHRAAAPPLATPVVKLFLQYHHTDMPYSPVADSPRFGSRAGPGDLPPLMGGLAVINPPCIAVATDPLTVPHVRRVWAAVKKWPDGRVVRAVLGSGSVWHDALLTESDVTRGRRGGSDEISMAEDDLRCVLAEYGLREFVDFEMSCYVLGVNCTDWVRGNSSTRRTKMASKSCNPVVRLVYVGNVWLAMVPGSIVNLLSGLWEVHDVGVYDPGVPIVVLEAERVCHGVEYTCMSTKRGIDSGPDAVRVAVALYRFGIKKRHRVPLLPTRAESLFRRELMETRNGRDNAAASAVIARATLTMDNIRLAWCALRGATRASDKKKKNMQTVDMEDVFAVYGLLRGVHYLLKDSAPFNNLKEEQATSKVSFVVVRQTSRWVLRASDAVRSYWHTLLDVRSAGVDVTSDVSRALWQAALPGFCPMLRQRRDSGPDVVRVMVAMHRYLDGGMTNLPTARYVQEVHTYREGGVGAQLTRLEKRVGQETVAHALAGWVTLASLPNLPTNLTSSRDSSSSESDLPVLTHEDSQTLMELDQEIFSNLSKSIGCPVKGRFKLGQRWAIRVDGGSGRWMCGVACMGRDAVSVTWSTENPKEEPQCVIMQFDEYDARFPGVDDAKVMVSRVQLADYGVCNVTLGQSKVLPEDIIGRVLQFLCDPTFHNPEWGGNYIIYEWAHYHPDMQPLSAL